MEEGVKVTCYAGYQADERPTSFTRGDRIFEVKAVLDRWYDQDYNCFKVLADDGDQYLLKHDMNEDRWEVVPSVAKPGPEPER